MHNGQQLKKMLLLDCHDINPSDVAVLVGELYVLHMGTAFRFTLGTDDVPQLKLAVKVAKRRGWFDEDAMQREEKVMGLGVLCLKFE